MNTKSTRIRILFVCMGNICRSPSAEAVMNLYLQKESLSHAITCESAGTLAYHAGEPADARMKKHANKRDIRLTSISRKILSEDFDEFDYLIAMDDDNLSDMQRYIHDEEHSLKIHKMTDFCKSNNYDEVPDPYYGGSQGFENVLDILEDACMGLLEHIRHEHKL